MEIIPEGRHFRLLQDSELPDVLAYLEQYLPEALKVCDKMKCYFFVHLIIWRILQN